MSSQSWSAGKEPGETRVVYTRSAVQFNDKKGSAIRIESLREGERPMFVFVEYGGEGGAMVVTNVLIGELQKQGVKVGSR
jgi:hypothetical protein